MAFAKNGIVALQVLKNLLPSNNYALLSLQKKHLPILEAWFEHPEVRKRLGGFLPLEKQVSLVIQDPNKWGWMVVNPTYQRRGYGTRFLTEVEQIAPVNSLLKLEAYIETDNLPSKKCFERAHYQQYFSADFVNYEGRGIEPDVKILNQAQDQTDVVLRKAMEMIE